MAKEWLVLQTLGSGNFLLQDIKAPKAAATAGEGNTIITVMNTSNLSAAFRAPGMVPYSREAEQQNTQSFLVRFCPAPVLYGVQQQNLERIAQIRTVTVVFMKCDYYNVAKHKDLLSLHGPF